MPHIKGTGTKNMMMNAKRLLNQSIMYAYAPIIKKQVKNTWGNQALYFLYVTCSPVMLFIRGKPTNLSPIFLQTI